MKRTLRYVDEHGNAHEVHNLREATLELEDGRTEIVIFSKESATFPINFQVNPCRQKNACYASLLLSEMYDLFEP